MWCTSIPRSTACRKTSSTSCSTSRAWCSLHGRDEVTLSLRKDGAGVVTAADIQTPHDVEILNPEHQIATLSAGAKLDMQIKVEKGRGYVPGNVRHGDDATRAIGRILLDASFSPIKRVSYAVENARVEQRTDLDKLVLEIETNGAVGPEEAVRAAAKILVEQLAVFAQLEGAEAFEAGAAKGLAPSSSIRCCCACRRARADRAFGQLPEGREHLLHR